LRKNQPKANQTQSMQASPHRIVTYYLRHFLSLMFAICIYHMGNAQVQAFAPAPENEAHLKGLLTTVEKSYQQHLSKLPSENKKDYLRAYGSMWEFIKEKFDQKEIYTADVAQQYLNALVAEIVNGNPQLKDKSFQVFFSRTGVPNAMYIGEGVILFNMGLFYRLDNEGQAAFTLCHELAHGYLGHGENRVNEWVNKINSDEFKSELKKISKSEFKQRSQLEALLKGMVFDSRKHSRDHEAQADSMAVELMRNTRFNLTESLTILDLLDKIDTDTLHVEASLQRLFNSKEYPFQKKWIAKEEGLLGGHAQLKIDSTLADSLKTHPDCKLRIKLLEPFVNKNNTGTRLQYVVSKTTFDELKERFAYEVVEYAFASKNYTKSLHYAMELLQQHPADPYLVAQVGKIFNGFYISQKEHTLSRVIEFPSPYQGANYNMLLQFIQNLYAENYASISYYFLKQYQPALSYYEPFKTAYNTSVQIAQQ
jgi:Zn-dependent protease with chaperone function